MARGGARPGSGPKPEADRCPCGMMTRDRAIRRHHVCSPAARLSAPASRRAASEPVKRGKITMADRLRAMREKAASRPVPLPDVIPEDQIAATIRARRAPDAPAKELAMQPVNEMGNE